MYKRAFSLISFVLLLVVVSSGSAATYYIDFDGGSDMDIFGSNHGIRVETNAELWENTANSGR